MKAVFRKAAALGLVFAMSCTALAGCGSKGSKIDGSKTLLTVNGEDVRLGVGSLYAKYQQASIYQIYSMYFGTTSIFDNEHDDGHTYGEEIKESVISDLEKMVTIKQHAEEYGVSLTDEETAAIETAAQAYMDGNDEETRAKIGAAKEDVVELMTLQTLQASMMDPIVKDVDTEISDEDAQQTSVSYIRIDVESEPEETESVEETVESGASGSEAAESETAQSAAESSEAASAESAAGSEAAESEAAESEAAQSAAESSEAASVESAAGSEAAESEAAQSEAAPVEATASSVEEAAAQIEAREYGEAIISAIQEEADVAEADLDAIAKTIDESYYVSTGSFTTNDPDDTYLDSVIVEAVKGLSDGELVDHPVMNADGTCYYVIRLDKNFDEEKTETKKSDILTERKQALYDETVNGWVDAADIKVNEDVWKLVGISDMDPVTLKAAEAESTEEEAESTAEATESTSESAVSEAKSAAESAASEAESAAGSAASEAESAAESAASEAESAAESAASEAESTVESAVSEAASTAESAE